MSSELVALYQTKVGCLQAKIMRHHLGSSPLTALFCGVVQTSWLCGYIRLPKGHPWYKVTSTMDERFVRAHVHGGVTYKDAEGWVGFDCNHYCDQNNPKDELYVRAEVEVLAEAVMKAMTE